jgi:hypothetical protein
MKHKEPYRGFEQGRIRPPSEAGSLLIRVSRNCPWNRCTFCNLYKNQKFSLRPVGHIIQDIDCVRDYVEQITQGRKLKPQTAADEMAAYAAMNWVRSGMKSVFLQDSNSLIMKPDDLVTVLQYLSDTFPRIERITSYARSHTIARVSDENLSRMRAAGLNRIHAGLESGSDTILAMVKKGTDKQKHILAGQKVKQAGIELSEYFMPGLGGKKLSREHATETADALNSINPDFIRLRTLAVPEDIGLADDVRDGRLEPMNDVEIAGEILLFIESLEGITSRVKSDHVLNLLQEVDGTLPGDKQRMTDAIKQFLALDEDEQMLFQIGRRTGVFSRLDDLNNERLRMYAKRTCDELKVNPHNSAGIIAAIMKTFI